MSGTFHRSERYFRSTTPARSNNKFQWRPRDSEGPTCSTHEGGFGAPPHTESRRCATSRAVSTIGRNVQTNITKADPGTPYPTLEMSSNRMFSCLVVAL
jgi:hypothetical protein